MSKKHVKNYDADEGLNARNMTTTSSANEATGMMYNPPHDGAELRSIRDMHALQSTEFAATEFGEPETAYTPEARGQYDAGVHYEKELSRHDAAQSRHDRRRIGSEDGGRRGRKQHDDPAEFNPELAKIDPDINCVNGHDDRHASLHPLSAIDWANGEGAKY